MTFGLKTEWDYSGRKGQRKKINQANEKRKKVTKSKDEEVNGQWRKKGGKGYPGPTQGQRWNRRTINHTTLYHHNKLSYCRETCMTQCAILCRFKSWRLLHKCTQKLHLQWLAIGVTEGHHQWLYTIGHTTLSSMVCSNNIGIFHY